MDIPELNSRIHLGQYGWGTVKYIGKLPDKDLIYYGIGLDEKKGTNNGIVKGKTFFETDDKHGIFISKRKLIEILQNVGDGTRIANKYIGKQVDEEDSIEEYKPTHFFSPEENIKEIEKNNSDENKKTQSEINENFVETHLDKEKRDIKKSDKREISNSEQNATPEMLNQNTVRKENIENKPDGQSMSSLKKLKLLYNTQKSYYKSQIEELNKKIYKNTRKDDKIRLENIELKKQLVLQNNKNEKLDENVLGMAKDLLKMKRNVDSVIESLESIDFSKKSFSRDKKIVKLFKDLTSSILNDDEPKVQNYYREYKNFMESRGIRCILD